MAKKTTDPKSETAKRIQRTEAYAEKVRKMFAQAVNEILAFNKSVPKLDEGMMYSFDGTSQKMQKQVEDLLRQLHSSVVLAIRQGITLEWEQANAECDKLVTSIFGKEALSNPKLNAITDRNKAAMDAFIQRTENGLNLSDRIWKTVRQLREEMEVAMTVAIGEGQSASQMSRKVREYLNDPDLMFRRFRYKDENGKWRRKWKKRIKDEKTGKYKWIDYDRDDYKTGAGVYKSSAKNAMRVTRTETNIAYRRADYERWQQMDFVLGQKIQLSKNHPMRDICDKLQGIYPKDFVFDGWHPQCFCFVTPVLVDEDEMEKMNEAFLDGKEYTPKGKQITEYPDEFKQWVRDNADNIAKSRSKGTEPYFIRNNSYAIDEILNPKQKELTTLEKAKLRHEARTPEQIKAIKNRWAERKKKMQGIEIEKINTPNIEYIADTSKLSYLERSDNMMKAVINYYGEDSKYGKAANTNLGLGYNESRFKSIKRDFNNWFAKSHGELNRLPAINRLNELKVATDLDVIPMQWRKTFNDIIKELNTHDFKKGYNEVVDKIEYAYNIYKLSKNSIVKSIGFDNISTKTPYQIFTEFEKKIAGFSSTIPCKEFFDRFSQFIPLYTSGAEGAFYSPYCKHVIISLSDKNNILRLTNSKWYRDGLFHHEYGHAFDDLNEQRKDAKLIAIYDKWAKSYNADNGAKIKEDISKLENEFMDDFKKRHKELYDDIEEALNKNDLKEWKNLRQQEKDLLVAEKMDFDEQLGALTDCIQAMLKKHEFIRPRGHSSSYFAFKEQQLAEFIAHCSENYWSGNLYFKKLSPQLYEEMWDFIKQFK